MQVAPTDGRGRDLEDDVGILGDVRDIGIDDLDAVGSLPGEGLHTLLAALADFVLVLDNVVLGRAGISLETAFVERREVIERDHKHDVSKD